VIGFLYGVKLIGRAGGWGEGLSLEFPDVIARTSISIGITN